MSHTEFYVQTTGSNLNAGSTVNDTAPHTYASGNWVASTGVFTVASGNPSSDGVAVGDFASVYADGATTTGFVGRVTARDATTITVSLTIASGTAPTDGTGTRTLKHGGAWKGPNAAEGFPFNFAAGAMVNTSSHPLRVNFKNGTNYAITAAMTDTLSGSCVFQGYTTSPDDGGRATIDGGTSGASYVLFTTSGVRRSYVDLIFQNNGATSTADGVAIGGNGTLVRRCVVNNVRGDGMSIASAALIIGCEVYAANVANTSGDGGFKLLGGNCTLVRCIAHDNAGNVNDGFSFPLTNALNQSLHNCIADTNGRYGYFLQNRGGNRTLIGCDAYNNVADGIRLNSGTAGGVYYIESCNLVKNGTGGTGYGIIRADALDNVINITNCAFGAGTQANTTGTISNIETLIENTVTYTTDLAPWTDPANGDFRIALTAAKGAGRGTFTQTAASYAGTVAYPDIGAAQHLETAAGGGAKIIGG